MRQYILRYTVRNSHYLRRISLDGVQLYVACNAPILDETTDMH